MTSIFIVYYLCQPIYSLRVKSPFLAIIGICASTASACHDPGQPTDLQWIDTSEPETSQTLRIGPPSLAPECQTLVGVPSPSALAPFIERCGIPSIEELLPRLDEEYRREYTLIYRSDSAQGASPSHPRALLFGVEADILLTFNGHPEQDGYHQLEMIEWDAEQKKFRPHEIRFGEGEVTWVRNPESCRFCHGDTTFKPNWAAYNMWEGVYGSVTRLGNDVMHSHQTEAANYQSFMRNQRNEGRYRSLPLHPLSMTELDSIYDPAAPAQLSPIYNGSPTEFADTANTHLADLLMEKNFVRIAHELTLHSRYEEFKGPLAAIAGGCVNLCHRVRNELCEHRYESFATEPTDIELFFPAATRAPYPSYEEIYAEVTRQGSGDLAFRMDLQAGVEPWDAPTPPINTPWLIDPAFAFEAFRTDRAPRELLEEPQRVFAALVYLAERYGVAYQNWSLDFRNGTYNLFGGRVQPELIFHAIFEEMVEHQASESFRGQPLDILANPSPYRSEATQLRYQDFSQCRALLQ